MIETKQEFCLEPSTHRIRYSGQDENQIKSCKNLHKLTLMDGDDVTVLIDWSQCGHASTFIIF